MLRVLTVLVLLLLLSQTSLADAARRLTFRYLGCYVELSWFFYRDLGGLRGVEKLRHYPVDTKGLVADSGMTHELCSQICSLGGFTYFGVQYEKYCSCDFSYGTYGSAAESDCSKNCAGNASQKCGGISRNAVYEIRYLDSNNFIRVPNFSTELVKVGSGLSANIDTPGVSEYLSGCLTECQAEASRCQAVFFTADSRCHLLRFAAMPSDLTSLAGELWSRA